MRNSESDYNQKAWDRVASAADKWFSAVTSDEIEFARSGRLQIKLTPTICLPDDWLAGIDDKDVLCLAGGGGRQGPLLSAAGANVTVFDISEAQLARDRMIAEREELKLRTIAGDMRDLSAFPSHQFDLIVNPTSVCYCDDVLSIWRECFRVLKTGGALIAGMINPSHYLFDVRKRDLGELEVRHKIPYSDWDLDEQERIELLGQENPREFGHSLATLVGGQIATGFQITGFFEDRWGGSDRLSELIPVFLCTKAEKLG